MMSLAKRIAVPPSQCPDSFPPKICATLHVVRVSLKSMDGVTEPQSGGLDYSKSCLNPVPPSPLAALPCWTHPAMRH